MTFSDFVMSVEPFVKEIVDGPYTVGATGTVYERGMLFVTLFEKDGRAYVSYNATPTHGGHSSSVSLPIDLTVEGAHLAAVYVADKLNNRFLCE